MKKWGGNRNERVVESAIHLREETNLRRHPLPFMNVLKTAALNINVISTRNRVAMLHAFVRYHDIDILLLQVTHPDLGDLPGYVTYTNIRTAMRGAAFVTRNELQVTNITKLPSGRGTSANCVGIIPIKLYAPSGTAKQAERENFFKT